MTTGVDTVGISFPIEDADTTGATATVVNFGTPEECYKYRRQLPGGGFLAWGVGDHAWIEASLPKRASSGESNVESVDADQALELIRDMYAEGLNYVRARYGDHVYSSATDAPRTTHRSWETAAVKRCDFVRDFDGVTAIDSLLNGLATVKQPGRSKVRRFADADRGLAETLRVGPKSWAATLYDKHAEAPTVAAPGRLRFEARLRSEQMTSVRARNIGSVINHVRDLTPTKVQTMTEATFRHVGFDREVAGTAQLAAAINACSDLSPRVKRELVGYLAGRAMGIELQFSSNTERKYRQLAARLGLVLSDESLSESFTARLDFDAGTQVLVAA
jgi:hypothetical protein